MLLPPFALLKFMQLAFALQMITDEMKINSAISTLKSIQPFCTNQGFEITNKMCEINIYNWNYKQIANEICKIKIDYFLVARIPCFHPGGLGSICTLGGCSFTFFDKISILNLSRKYKLNFVNNDSIIRCRPLCPASLRTGNCWFVCFVTHSVSFACFFQYNF